MGDQRWVVEHRGTTLRQVLAKMGADPSLLADGCVFVARRRALLTDLDQALEVGVEVLIFTARETSEVCVLAERSGLLAVLKPAGISTQPDHRGARASLLGHLAELVGAKLDTFHALHRLDREVSGVVLVAQGRQGLGIVETARCSGGFRRRYIAIASATPAPVTGRWHAPIGRGRRPGLRGISGIDAKPASTRYSVVRSLPTSAATLIICEPETGRTHQIRVHAAAAGAPLLGDGDYGGAKHVTSESGVVSELRRIALHAALVEVEAPQIGLFRVAAPVPADFSDIWQLLGGNPNDFEATLGHQWLA